MKRMARRMMAGTLAMLLLAGQWTAGAGRAAEGVTGAGETVLETIIIDNDRTGAPNTPGGSADNNEGLLPIRHVRRRVQRACLCRRHS
ncbi:hypothetical protein [Paenibacillus sp. YN15]|uniref:hypothetical protein n=1 Tax=Paenibacillus sp. YN15 TaxID=1742774 RepID=UPI0015EB3147|nr:hypothetical protein [Paenibacillus sp. YN15]